MLPDKVEYLMASRTAEQTAGSAGGGHRLAVQGLVGRGYSSSCMAATTLRAIRDNIQGNIGAANAMWMPHARKPCAAGTRARSSTWLFQSEPCRCLLPNVLLHAGREHGIRSSREAQRED
ncbi:hypothetical protein MTO96_018128 [Rhipicephalus appendiculatus]